MNSLESRIALKFLPSVFVLVTSHYEVGCAVLPTVPVVIVAANLLVRTYFTLFVHARH